MGINSIEALRGNRLMLRGIGMTDRELDILGISHAGEKLYIEKCSEVCYNALH